MRRGIRRLPPGCLLTWDGDATRIREYWHPLAGGEAPPASYEDGRRRLRELLDDSVRLQLVSDVPLGAFLSGGVDSTAIAGLMARRTPSVHTFSIGFSQDPRFDETRYAREAAAFHGTRHSEHQLVPGGIEDAIPGLLDRLAEPFGSASLLPTFAVSRETRRHMTVALSGDGADELFAGYDKYLGEVYRRWWSRIPAAVRHGMVEPAVRALPADRSSRAGELGRKARRFLDGAELDPAERHERWMRFAAADEVGRLLGEAGRANPGLEIVRRTYADFDARGNGDPLNRTLFTDLRLALPTDMLLKVDTASMLNSLEVRVPFLDHRVVELATSMPSSWKMDGTVRKKILRDAVGDLLPEGIRRRGKAGFDLPVGEWLKTSLSGMFRDVIASEGSIPLDRALLDRWFEEHRSGKADRTKVLWAAFALRWWDTRVRQVAPAPAEPALAEVS
jgi:asparagine synthase (glutamine-hydrolysing)